MLVYNLYVILSLSASVAVALIVILLLVLELKDVLEITGAVLSSSVFCVMLLLVFSLPALSVTTTFRVYVVLSAKPVYVYELLLLVAFNELFK